LFLNEAIGENDEEELREIPREEDDPGEFFLEEFTKISLTAIIGTPNPKTMRIVGILKYQQVTVLVDSGSTHNFLDIKIAAILGIQPMAHDGITIQVANGQEVASPGRCREVGFKMKGYVFKIDLFKLPLAGCDIVLGIQWLHTLGPIFGDFVKLKMQFSLQGQSCVLQGIQQGPNVSLEEG